MAPSRLAALALALLPIAPAAAQEQAKTLICLAPASAEMTSGNTEAAVAAVGESFKTFLTGPSLAVQPLTARLASQVREEARLAKCPYLLLTTVKHTRKHSGGGLLGRVAAGAVRDGAWSVAGGVTSTAGRVAASAAASAASEAASNVASQVRNKDEMALTYRLETPDGSVLVEKSDKRQANSDGEDLLTPMVQRAAEGIATAVTSAARSSPPNGGRKP